MPATNPPRITALSKGMPLGVNLTPEEALAQGWNVLADDLHLPLLVLRESALAHNIEAMAAWCRRHDALLAPHGKTSMAPRIWQRQIEAGAWGITVANASQAMVAAEAKIRRILIANQLVGRANIRSVAGALEHDPDLEMLCLVDSVEGTRHLGEVLAEAGAVRPVNVLLEWGRTGWRTGVRSVAAGKAVCSEIERHADYLRWRGFEGFEGSAAGKGGGPDDEHGLVDEFLADLLVMARELRLTGDATAEKPILSIGGSAFIDLVGGASAAIDRQEFQLVVRSGCYVTHDHGGYARHLAGARARGSSAEAFPELQPALELWAYVQSLPDPDLAILTFGKRDCPYDIDLPRPLFALAAGAPLSEARPLAAAGITATNDQHAFMQYPNDTRLQVGDKVCCGISHPCTAFDKWRVVPLVDDAYNVIDLYPTWF